MPTGEWVTISIPKRTSEQLTEMAEALGRSKSWVVQRLVSGAIIRIDEKKAIGRWDPLGEQERMLGFTKAAPIG